MAGSVKFEDYSVEVKGVLEDAAIAFLHEAAGELVAQTKRNQTRVGTGQTKDKWKYMVDEDKLQATIGNPLENAIWEEFGTGEYALNGNGRKGGWVYKDDKGEFHFTFGKTPLRPFFTAMTKLKPKLEKMAAQKLKGKLK